MPLVTNDPDETRRTGARQDDAPPKASSCPHWFHLVIAGLLEAAWAIRLTCTHGFTRPVPSVLTAGALVASFWLLATTVRTRPIGTAYAVWVGIGATGAVILGALLFREPLSGARAFFLALLIVAIVGLRWTAPPPDAG